MTLIIASGTDLRNQNQALWIGTQRFADELVGDVGSVELSGVDVIDAGVDRTTNHGQGIIPVPRRSQDPGSGKLHGAKPNAMDRSVGEQDSIAEHGTHTGLPEGSVEVGRLTPRKFAFKQDERRAALDVRADPWPH